MRAGVEKAEGNDSPVVRDDVEKRSSGPGHVWVKCNVGPSGRADQAVSVANASCEAFYSPAEGVLSLIDRYGARRQLEMDAVHYVDAVML